MIAVSTAILLGSSGISSAAQSSTPAVDTFGAFLLNVDSVDFVEDISGYYVPVIRVKVIRTILYPSFPFLPPGTPPRPPEDFKLTNATSINIGGRTVTRFDADMLQQFIGAPMLVFSTTVGLEQVVGRIDILGPGGPIPGYIPYTPTTVGGTNTYVGNTYVERYVDRFGSLLVHLRIGDDPSRRLDAASWSFLVAYEGYLRRERVVSEGNKNPGHLDFQRREIAEAGGQELGAATGGSSSGGGAQPFNSGITGSINGTYSGNWAGNIGGIPGAGTLNGNLNGIFNGTATGTFQGNRTAGAANGTLNGILNGTYIGSVGAGSTLNGNPTSGNGTGNLNGGNFGGAVNVSTH